MSRPAIFNLAALGLAILLLTACERGGRTNAPLTWQNFSIEKLDALGYDRAMVKIPAANPWTAAKAELGRHLFFDRRL